MPTRCRLGEAAHAGLTTARQLPIGQSCFTNRPASGGAFFSVARVPAGSGRRGLKAQLTHTTYG